MEVFAVLVKIKELDENILVPLDTFLKYTNIEIPFDFEFESPEELDEFLLECGVF